MNPTIIAVLSAFTPFAARVAYSYLAPSKGDLVVLATPMVAMEAVAVGALYFGATSYGLINYNNTTAIMTGLGANVPFILYSQINQRNIANMNK